VTPPSGWEIGPNIALGGTKNYTHYIVIASKHEEPHMSVDLEQDPRVYFAAERTFLAWIRTGVGFAVARFSLFLREVQPAAVHTTGLSLWAGVALVVVGIVVTLKTAIDYQHLIRRLKSGSWQPGGISASATLLAGTLTLIGLGMAIYLIVIR
jgi:putative membrane protein